VKGIVNIVLFKAVWLGSLVGAGSGRPWLGLMLLAGFALVHFRLTPNPRADAWLLGAAAVCGLCLDTLFAQAGLLDYAQPLPVDGMAPFWIVVMWMNFALTLNVSMRWLQGRPWLAVLLGAAGGPLAYVAGVSLGAAAWVAPPQTALTLIGIAWAVAVPALTVTACVLNQRLAPVRATR